MNYLSSKYRTLKYNLENLRWYKIKLKLYLIWIGGIHYGYFLEPRKQFNPVRFKLFKLFERLGCEASKNPFRSKSYATWLFSINKGWRDLVFNCTRELVNAGWNKNLLQIKEKFGSLRYYIGSATEEQHKIISKYERLSYKTCQRCGSTDSVSQTEGWICTLCKNCMKNI